MNYIDCWNKIKTVSEAKKLICIRKGDFRPDEDLDKLPLSSVFSFLDFGCGVGRNLQWFVKALGKYTHGYDYPNMTELAKQYLPKNELDLITFLNPPIENLKKFKFDLITAILVFQHIREQELRQILPILAGCLHEDGLLYVHSNSTMCEGLKSTAKVLLDFFEPVQFITPADLHKRIPDTPLVNNLARYFPHTHFKVLMKPKIL